MNFKPLRFEDFPEDKHSLIRAILKCGGNPVKFSRYLGVSHQYVRGWLTEKGRPIPPKYCVLIEKLTYGEITRQNLRPDVFGDVLEPYPSIHERLQKCIGTLKEITTEMSENIKKRGK